MSARRNRSSWCKAALVFSLVLPVSLKPAHAQGKPTIVEPEVLTKRPDLVGKEIEVDDRARFQSHPDTGYDQVLLKRAPEVICEIPRALRPRHPSAPSVKVRGILRKENSRIFIEVTALDLLPSDLDRFNRGLAFASKNDTDTRMGWIRWADRRIDAFQPKDAKHEVDPIDVALAEKSREVEAEVIRIESDKPPKDATADYWVKLAERARSRRIPEPEPSAQAHKGFRVGLADARKSEDFKALLAKIAAFLPNAKSLASTTPDLTRWNASYRNNPAEAYRQANAIAREALDRRLWADTVQAWIEKRAEEDPKGLVSLSEDAFRLLPDRPIIASSLLEKGVTRATEDVGSLRLSEVESLAKVYDEKMHQPDKGKALYRAWLDDQRLKRLSPRDADGRLTLADQYESLLKDRETAASLLRAAWAIDPLSKETAEAFRRRGFKKVNDEWIEGSSQTNTSANESPAAGAPKAKVEGEEAEPLPAAKPRTRDRGHLLRGATRDEVRIELGGRPSRWSYVASQGQLVEQWIYYQNKTALYINFRHKGGESTPVVVSYYSLPRASNDAPSAP